MPESLPAFYTVLPASVRYAPALSDFQKLLWAEIAALSHKHGYCHAKNACFARVFGKDPSTVKRALAGLVSAGLVLSLCAEGSGRRLHAVSSDEERFHRTFSGDRLVFAPGPAHFRARKGLVFAPRHAPSSAASGCRGDAQKTLPINTREQTYVSANEWVKTRRAERRRREEAAYYAAPPPPRTAESAELYRRKAREARERLEREGPGLDAAARGIIEIQAVSLERAAERIERALAEGGTRRYMPAALADTDAAHISATPSPPPPPASPSRPSGL